MGKKKTIEEAREIVEGKNGNGCKLLSTEYINNHTPLDILCACGEPFRKSLKDFENGGKQCPKCGKKMQIEKQKNRVLFNCDCCGKESETTPSAYNNSKNHFCSVECKNKWQSENNRGENNPLYNRIEYKCDNCGEPIEITQSQYDNSKNHFCSQECKAEWQRKNNGGKNSPLYNRIVIKCDYCHKDFEIIPSRYDRAENHFCWRECKDNYWSENVKTGENHPRWVEKFIIQCSQCGEDLEPMTQYQIDQYEHHFCCTECRNEWISENLSGENSPNYNPDLTDEERFANRDYPKYKQWRNEVYKRDYYTCQCCGKHGSDIEAHHINGHNWDKEHRTDIDNGITLCTDCHSKFHKEYGYGHNTLKQFEEFVQAQNYSHLIKPLNKTYFKLNYKKVS